MYAPKTPYKFFDDTLLYGMFIKALGDSDANRFKTIYQFTNTDEEGKDISSSFVEAYSPDFDDPAFMKALSGSQAVGRRHGKINSEFNYDLFFTHLSEVSQIKQDAFTKKDMKEIERLSTLYGISEEESANAVSSIYDPYVGKGKHVDFAKLTSLFQEQNDYSYLLNKKLNRRPNQNSGSSELAGKINIMETRSPKEFLALLQNGSKPAVSDLKIVDDLSKNFHLNNCVINAVVDFVLTTNNNVLARPLCEKIGASLAREGVTTTIDAMNYLKKVSRGNRKEKVQEISLPEREEPVKTSQKSSETPLNWDELLDDIDDGEGGNSDGKA